MDTSAPCATPCADLPRKLETLDGVLTRAAAHGVEIDAYVSDGEIWINDIQRTAKGLKDAGKIALTDIQRYAEERGLSVGLAVWAVNDGLRAYYHRLGFRVVHEPAEEELEGHHDHAELQWRPGLDIAAAAS